VGGLVCEGAVKLVVELVIVVVTVDGVQVEIGDMDPEVLDEVLEQGGQVDGVTVVEQEPDVTVDVVLYVEGGGQVDGVTVVEQEPDVTVDIVLHVEGGGQVDGVTVVEQEPDVTVEIVLYVDTEVVVVV